MQVLFIKNIKGVAQIGDIKNVSAGYARNFLFPKNLAKIATADAAKQAETLKMLRSEQEVKSKADAEILAKKLEGTVVELAEDASDEGHLYGSVDAKKIASAVHLDPSLIDLPHNLKTVGEHKVVVQLHPTISVTLTILISRVLPS